MSGTYLDLRCKFESESTVRKQYHGETVCDGLDDQVTATKMILSEEPGFILKADVGIKLLSKKRHGRSLDPDDLNSS
jgi:hypothetical protein